MARLLSFEDNTFVNGMSKLNYSSRENIGGSSNAINFTVSKAGYVQLHTAVGGSNGNTFARIMINNVVVYENQDKVSNSYLYDWSPLFPVFSGDIIYCPQADANAVHTLYFYEIKSS